MKQLPSVNSELDDELIDKIFKNHFDILSPFFLKLMSEWTIGAYKVFKDIDTYTILIYLISKQFDFYRRNNLNITFNNFYKDKTLEIEKINLIRISKDLQIPKESVRRKVISLEKKGIIKKKGKKITMPQIITRAKEKHEKVILFPLHEECIDLGSVSEYNDMQ